MGSVSSLAELRSHPARLLNSAGGSEELTLLASLRAQPAPAGAKVLVWKALGVQVSATAVATSSSWAPTYWRGLLKTLAASKAAAAVPIVVASLAAGAAGAAGALQYGRGAPTHSVSPSPSRSLSVQAPSPPAKPPAANAIAVATVEASEPSPSKATTRATSHPPVRDHLREESALLARARAELHDGNPRAAQATLFHMQTQFPNGALSQEREVLGIEALAARGNAVAAERNARAFIIEHPESPHAVQLLRRFLE